MKKSALVLGLAFALPGLSQAAAPVAYGTGVTLAADNVTMTHVCPAGFTCGQNPIIDNNFVQVEMTDNVTGETFFRSVVMTNDPTAGASESFTSESFVKMGGTGGIASQQTLNSDVTNSGTLSSTTNLATGDFNGTYGGGANELQVNIAQDVRDTATNPQFHAGMTYTKNAAGTVGTTNLTQEIVVPGANDGFSDSFAYTQDKDVATDAVIGTKLDILSGVVLNTGGALTDQAFSYQVREGTYNNSPLTGTATHRDGVQSVTWNNGDKVEQVLVGQFINGGGDFGYERIGDVTAAAEITDFDLAQQGPFATITGDNPFSAVGDPSLITVQ